MRPYPTLAQLDALRGLDTCTLANALEAIDNRLRNEGYTDGSIRCVFPKLAPLLGHAVPLRIRCSSPPPRGGHYLDRTDWWSAIEQLPIPRVAVIEDLEAEYSVGSTVGEVHAAILKAFRSSYHLFEEQF